MSKIIIPANYKPALNLYDTQRAIGTVKRLFADTLCATLNLYRVSAPLFLEASTGLNDDLNGVERKVTFDIKDSGTEAQVVQSLAKWKRQALKDYDFRVGKGLYCDMNAIRRDEELDNLHSVYVDQWDWEKVIREEDRSEAYLKNVVRGHPGHEPALCLACLAAGRELPQKEKCGLAFQKLRCKKGSLPVLAESLFSCFAYSRGIPAFAQAARVASSQTLACTSPMWALPSSSMHRRLWPMPPPMV